jgi:predicted Zn-dependent protease
LRKRGAATVAGRSGFEAIADGDSGKGKLNHLVDVVPAGDRIFMLVAAGPKGFATGDEAEKFRDSFRVLADQPDPSQAAATAPAQ